MGTDPHRVLVNYACLQFRDPLTGYPFEWEFHRARTVLPVATKGPLLLTGVNTMLATCLAGRSGAMPWAVLFAPTLD